MNKILEFLQLTPDEYESMYFEAYMRWCMDFSINYENDLQKLLANTAISKYYKVEYSKCETEFLTTIEPYKSSKELSEKDARYLYSDCTYQMFNRRPKSLIDAAKKISILNDTTAN